MGTSETTEHALVLSTAGDLTEAHRLAGALVERRLAACVQISQISSVYVWNGAIETEPETRLVIKTRKALFPALEAALKELHSYDCPQILMVAVGAGSADYLAWLDESTQAD